MDNIAEAKLCPDGLLFEDGNPNQEKCDYPFNVNCGSREFVRELTLFHVSIHYKGAFINDVTQRGGRGVGLFVTTGHKAMGGKIVYFS